MTSASQYNLSDLPELVQKGLTDFLASAQAALGLDLQSVVLYGSGAEGKLRSTSDVNVVLVLTAFDSKKIDALREPLRLHQASIRLAVMFLLKPEIHEAAEFFAVKFSDVHRRHRVLYGEDPFASLVVSREATIARVRQVLLNLILRMRAMYAYRSLREEQIAFVLADVSGPIRATALSLLELEGQSAGDTKEALQKVCASLPNNKDWLPVLKNISEVRENRVLPPGVAGPTLIRLIDLVHLMLLRAEQLS